LRQPLWNRIILAFPYRAAKRREGAIMEATWKPPQHQTHGKLDAADTNTLPDNAFAYPKKRKEPMTDASHVRNAIARFDQVKDVSDAEREEAFANIKKAANHFGIEMKETTWRELGSRPRSHQQAS
jgi:uncharacterized protein DUF6582